MLNGIEWICREPRGNVLNECVSPGRCDSSRIDEFHSLSAFCRKPARTYSNTSRYVSLEEKGERSGSFVAFYLAATWRKFCSIIHPIAGDGNFNLSFNRMSRAVVSLIVGHGRRHGISGIKEDGRPGVPRAKDP